MDISIFLAKVFGIYLIVSGLLYAFKHNTMRYVINDYFDNNAVVMLGGIMSLMIGILLMVSHSVWEPNWKIVITVFGYMTFFKGIMHLFFPSTASSWASKMTDGSYFVYISIVTLMLGIYLTYVGYFA
ncbi:MAG: hypothetical protein VX777_00305 [Chlamydiota bacterium]|nr:hypothetical protein [Chlamydiota bacterium]